MKAVGAFQAFQATVPMCDNLIFLHSALKFNSVKTPRLIVYRTGRYLRLLMYKWAPLWKLISHTSQPCCCRPPRASRVKRGGCLRARDPLKRMPRQAETNKALSRRATPHTILGLRTAIQGRHVKEQVASGWYFGTRAGANQPLSLSALAECTVSPWRVPYKHNPAPRSALPRASKSNAAGNGGRCRHGLRAHLPRTRVLACGRARRNS